MQDQAKQPRKKANRHKTYNGTGETTKLTTEQAKLKLLDHASKGDEA